MWGGLGLKVLNMVIWQKPTFSLEFWLISQWSFFYGGGYFSAKLGNVNVVFKDSTDDDSIESALFPHSKAERKGGFYYSLILLKEKIILLPKSLSV